MLNCYFLYGFLLACLFFILMKMFRKENEYVNCFLLFIGTFLFRYLIAPVNFTITYIIISGLVLSFIVSYFYLKRSIQSEETLTIVGDENFNVLFEGVTCGVIVGSNNLCKFTNPKTNETFNVYVNSTDGNTTLPIGTQVKIDSLPNSSSSCIFVEKI